MRWIPSILVLAMLAGCAHSGAAPTSVRPAGAVQAADATSDFTDVNPDQAVEKATKKAREWQPDARLVGVFWGVAKFQTTSIIFHFFHSPKAGRVLQVETKLTTLWMGTKEITDRKVTWPAKLLGTLEQYPVTAKDVLEKSKSYLPPNQDNPIAALVLWKPNRFTPAFWLVKADQEKLLFHAKSGKVLVHTDFDFPFVPIASVEAEQAQ